jgi:hypothetical protein
MGEWMKLLEKRELGGTGPTSLRRKLPKILMAVSGLRHLPVYNQGPVYCGKDYELSSRADVAAARRRFRRHQVEHADSFLSTAKSYGASFAATKNGYDVCWVITGIRTGHDIQLLSLNDQEEEVLFPPGATFVITRVVDDTQNTAGRPLKLMVHLTEVSSV